MEGYVAELPSHTVLVLAVLSRRYRVDCSQVDK